MVDVGGHVDAAGDEGPHHLGVARPCRQVEGRGALLVLHIGGRLVSQQGANDATGGGGGTVTYIGTLSTPFSNRTMQKYIQKISSKLHDIQKYIQKINTKLHNSYTNISRAVPIPIFQPILITKIYLLPIRILYIADTFDTDSFIII